MNKKVIIGIVLALAIAIGGTLALNGSKQPAVNEEEQNKIEYEVDVENSGEVSESPEAEKQENSDTAIETGTKENKPTFIYFVTNADKEAVKTVEKLKGEYEDKVLFQIMNIDENKALIENYAFVNGNTPALIMLGPTGDIVNLLMKTEEYDKLKAALDASLDLGE